MEERENHVSKVLECRTETGYHCRDWPSWPSSQQVEHRGVNEMQEIEMSRGETGVPKGIFLFPLKC